MHEIEYNKIFEFDLTGQVSFGNVTIDKLYNRLRDGRVFSHLMEIWLEENFPIKFVNKVGFDHVLITDSNSKFELKGLTKAGCSLLPSKMKGAGRKADLNEWRNTAKDIDYIIADNTKFPKIRVIFAHGKDLVNHYPNGVIK